MTGPFLTIYNPGLCKKLLSVMLDLRNLFIILPFYLYICRFEYDDKEFKTLLDALNTRIQSIDRANPSKFIPWLKFFFPAKKVSEQRQTTVSDISLIFLSEASLK